MDSGSTLMFGMLFGAIGTGFIVYGKKQRKGVALLSGLVLCIYPYFIDSTLLLFLIASVLIALPFVIRS